MKKTGNILITVGVVFLLSAFLITLGNIITDKKGSEAAQQIVEKMDIPAEPETDRSKLLFGDYDMPLKEIDSIQFVGIISIPEIGACLPVANEYSTSNLRKGPCLYSGTIYGRNAVICAHNYSGHFRKLNALTYGSKVLFYDNAGREYEYEVSDIVLINGYDIETMLSEDGWDLTLFTCNYSGNARVTLRCNLVNN